MTRNPHRCEADAAEVDRGNDHDEEPSVATAQAVIARRKKLFDALDE